MSFQDAVAIAITEQDAAVPQGAKRIGTTIGGLGVYRAGAATKDAMKAAGLELGRWSCRSPVDGRTIPILGWRLP